MSLRPDTLSSMILTVLCMSCSFASMAFAQHEYHERTGSADRYLQHNTESTANNDQPYYTQQRPTRSSRYRAQDNAYDQSDSSDTMSGQRGNDGSARTDSSDDDANTPAYGSNNANSRFGNRLNSSDRYSGRGSQSDSINQQRGAYGQASSNINADNSYNSYSSYNGRSSEGSSAGRSSPGSNQNNDSNNYSGRNVNSSRHNNQRNVQLPAVSPVLQAAILPAGWQRVSGSDVPAFPQTLPSLPATVRSDDGVNVTVSDTVRVITSGDDIISVIEAMGMGSLVFAAPEGASTVTGQAAPHHLRFDSQLNAIDKIANLNATLFICGNLRLCRPWASQLRRSSSMPVVIVDDQQPAPDRVRKIASAIGLPAQGKAMSSEIQEQFDRAQAMARQMPMRQSVLIIAVKDGRPVVAGNSTPPDELLRIAGARNVCSQNGIDGYASLSRRELTLLSPDVILISDYDLAKLGGANNFWNAIPGLKETPAGRQSRVWVMPDLQLKGASVATGAAALALSQALQHLGQR